MKAIMDLHTHTLAAGHAYSTLLENIDAALAMGLPTWMKKVPLTGQDAPTFRKQHLVFL